MFIDTHAHLFYHNFEDDLPQVLDNAKANGVDAILIPATDLKSCEQIISLLNKYDCLYGAVGIHPHDTKDWDDSFIDELRNFAQHEKIVAIGEIGLDYFYDYSPRDIQQHAFKKQIELALELDLPVVVHTRDSDDDVMKIISDYSTTKLRAQLHCFNSSLDHALKYIRMGHFISFTGNITFKKFDALRETAKRISIDHLLIETDSPFMTPVPHRGKRNEPAFVQFVAKQLAELHNVSEEDVARITSYNALKLFGIGKKPETSITYKIRDSLYVNLTNRCNADCVFCTRKDDAAVHGYNLQMEKKDEPSVETVISQIGDPKKYHEIVFCGYGEPTIRWDDLKLVAIFVKDNGGKTRLNTNGHGNIINARNIVDEMPGVIDSVSISLNSTEADQYSNLMRVNKENFSAMIEFAKSAKEKNIHVTLSVVSLEDVEIEKAKKFVEEEIGVEFRVRQYF